MEVHWIPGTTVYLDQTWNNVFARIACMHALTPKVHFFPQVIFYLVCRQILFKLEALLDSGPLGPSGLLDFVLHALRSGAQAV